MKFFSYSSFLRRGLFLSILVMGGLLVFAIQAHAGASLTRTPSSGTSPLTVSFTFSGAAPTFTEVCAYIDYGDGTQSSGRCGNKSTGLQHSSHTYSGPPGSSWDAQTIATWNGGSATSQPKTISIPAGPVGPPPECSDGIDNDNDGAIDYPADPGCTGPSDNTELDNTWPAWVDIYVNSDLPDVNWRLNCPTGSYSCNGATGTGTEAPMSESKCTNGQCAGVGQYKVHPTYVPPGWDCIDGFDYRTEPPPTVANIILDINCFSTTPTPPPNSNPTASNVTLTEPDYCTLGPGGTLSWIFSDPDLGDAQSAYQVQISNSIGFGNPDIDSGKVLSLASSYQVPQGILNFNTQYYARVRVWDSNGGVSGWGNMAVCTGKGCSVDQQSWTTPQHQYPGSVDFTFTPSAPIVNQLVQFDKSTTTCYALGGSPIACTTYNWNFGDGTPGTGPSPTHAYSTNGGYTVTFQVQDAQGYTCPITPLSKPINVNKPLPNWKEVQPK